MDERRRGKLPATTANVSDGSDEACNLILIRTVDGRERRDCGHFQRTNYQNR